jgi:hypothetical protein
MKPAWISDDIVELVGPPELVKMLGLRPYQNLSDPRPGRRRRRRRCDLGHNHLGD